MTLDDFTPNEFWLRLEVALEFVRDGKRRPAAAHHQRPDYAEHAADLQADMIKEVSRWAMIQYALAACENGWSCRRRGSRAPEGHGEKPMAARIEAEIVTSDPDPIIAKLTALGFELEVIDWPGQGLHHGRRGRAHRARSIRLSSTTCGPSSRQSTPPLS